MKKRIALVSNNWTPYSGGVVSSLRIQLDALQKAGYEPCLITLDFLGNHEDPTCIKRIKTFGKFTYKANRMAIPWRPTKQMIALFREFKPDIVHVHHPFLLGASALRAARQLNIPIVFTYHSQYEAFAHYIPLPVSIIRPIIRYLVKSFCKRVDGIIAPSSVIKKNIQNTGIKTPIVVIASALQPIFLHKTMPIKQQKKRFELICVSRFVQEKNIPFLLDLYAQLPFDRFTFTLAGYGYAFKTIKSYAYETLRLKSQDIVFIHKPVQSALAELYVQGDLFLFSAQHETQGIVFVEAMAGANPVVCLDGAGQRDIVEQGINGFIVDTADQMVEIVQKIAQDQKLYQELSEQAWKTAQRYTPDYMVAQLISFYCSFWK
jgi:glycosyltransferase involved in cell wall biosynthesis